MSAVSQTSSHTSLPEPSRAPDPQLSPHSADTLAVARAFNVDAALGLSSSEVLARRARYGANTIQSVRPRPAWRILIDQFASIVIALLAVAAAVSWATGEVMEAIAILVVLVINALVGFVTKWQAGRSRTHSAFAGQFINPFIWIATVIVICLQLLAVYLSPLAQVLGMARPSESDWLIVSLCLVAPVGTVELTKAVVWWKRPAIDARALEAN